MNDRIDTGNLYIDKKTTRLRNPLKEDIAESRQKGSNVEEMDIELPNRFPTNQILSK